MHTIFSYFVLEWLGQDDSGQCGGPDKEGVWGTGSGMLEGEVRSCLQGLANSERGGPPRISKGPAVKVSEYGI